MKIMPTLRKALALGLVPLCAIIAPATMADTTDLWSAPFEQGAALQIRPNLMFIMDDSGSMADDTMPDAIGGYVFDKGVSKYYYAYRSSQCNGLAYKPSTTYNPPLDYEGKSYPNATFTAAWKDGFNTGLGKVDLTGSVFYTYSGTEAAEAKKTYTAPTSVFMKECTSHVGDAPGSTVFTEVKVDATTAPTGVDGLTNYANWYSYYRTRVNLMKSATSIAFKGIDDRYRVGYMSINNNNLADFLNIGVFDSARKKAWYDLLLKQKVSNSTPTRSALALAGRIFANKLDTYANIKVEDPMEFACQKNFAILSTDGFWNNGSCTNDSAGCYNSGKGTKLDGTDIGDQDHTGVSRPYFDGSSLAVVQKDVTVTVDTGNTKFDRNTTKSRTLVVTRVPTTTDTVSDYTIKRTSFVTNDGCGITKSRRKDYVATTTKTVSTVVNKDTTTQVDNIESYSVTAPFTQTTTDTKISTTIGDSTTTTVTTSVSKILGTLTSTVTDPAHDVTTVTKTTSTSTTLTSWSPFVYKSGITKVTDITTWSLVTNNCVPKVTASDKITSDSFTTKTLAPVDGTPTVISSTAQPGYPVNADGAQTDSDVTKGTPTTTTSTTTTGTAIAGTMADIAYYYWKTDLRSPELGNDKNAKGVDVSNNDLVKDENQRQYMTTFTVGLGVRGLMVYDPLYPTSTSGDFYNVKVGTVNDASKNPCSFAAASKPCNWPVPAADNQTAVDDLWHAAVNGRGLYFSAVDADTLASGLAKTFKAIEATTGAAAAASTSQQVISSKTTTYMFRSTFKSSDWYGELIRQTIDGATGEVKEVTNWDDCPADICDWSARKQLETLVGPTSDTRKIFTYDPTNDATRIKDFAWGSLTDPEKKLFLTPAIDPLSQFADFTAADKAAAEGANLVAFLRGQRGYEGKYYRTRKFVLGDIVSSEAVYVTMPPYSYGDQGYTAFATSLKARKPVVYVGSNDGMLHAFDVDKGSELWAYVPSHVLPDLYKLADVNYDKHHRFFVDGSPVVGDACVSACGTDKAVWKTLLIGGLNAGGRGYYALDVTDPDNPKGLWEFTFDTSKGAGYTTDADLGYTFGNPIITKRDDGTWVVMVTSGYNNVAPGTGEGFLFVLDAATGAKLTTKDITAGKIGTGVGSDSTSVPGACSTPPCPSGLAMISAWANDARTDNTTLRVYGGDLYGNLWRFDINDFDGLGASGYDAQHMATFETTDKVRQPVVVPPELTEIDKKAVVIVGTGKMLGESDIAATDVQSMYAIKDTLKSDDWEVIRGRGDVIEQKVEIITETLPDETVVEKGITATNTAVDWEKNIGWFFDLPHKGERANTQPALARGILVFNTNKPFPDTCFAGGESFQYQVDSRNGGPDATSGLNSGRDGTLLVGTRLAGALATRVTLVELQLDGGQSNIKALTVGRDGKLYDTDVGQGHTSSTQKRVSWRELFSDR